MATLTIRLGAEQQQRLEAACDQLGVTASTFARDALDAALGALQPEPAPQPASQAGGRVIGYATTGEPLYAQRTNRIIIKRKPAPRG